MRKTPTHPPTNEYPAYDTKQSDGEVPVMLELWKIVVMVVVVVVVIVVAVVVKKFFEFAVILIVGICLASNYAKVWNKTL